METWDLPTVHKKGFVKGLCEGVTIGIESVAGFPSMKTIPFISALGVHGVRVFQQESK